MTSPYSWDWVTCEPGDADPDDSNGGCINFTVCADDDEAESLMVVLTTDCGEENHWFEFGGEDCPDGDYCDRSKCK